MKIGVPTEIKAEEKRVAITPAGVREAVEHGNEVLIQAGAGEGSSYSDDEYRAQGATIVDAADEVYGKAELLFKVKEPQESEIAMLHEGQILFAYLHLAPDEEQTKGLVRSGVTAVAFETVVDKQGHLPLLAPMSAVAGRLSIQEGARMMEEHLGGSGKLIGGVPGVLPANVVVLGGGVVGTNAARVAAGMGARVLVLDKSLDRLSYLDDVFGNLFKTEYSTTLAVEEAVRDADLVIGSVLVPGAMTPHLVTRDMLSVMKPRTCMVDVAIDQGGCFETSHPTTHHDSTFEVEGIIHYCVANMPGAVANTSTQALANATLPYLLRIAGGGLGSLREADDLKSGVNVHHGMVTYQPVAAAHGMDYTAAEDALR